MRLEKYPLYETDASVIAISKFIVCVGHPKILLFRQNYAVAQNCHRLRPR